MVQSVVKHGSAQAEQNPDQKQANVPHKEKIASASRGKLLAQKRGYEVEEVEEWEAELELQMILEANAAKVPIKMKFSTEIVELQGEVAEARK